MPKIAILGTAHPHVFQLVDAARKISGAEFVGVYDDDAARRKLATEKIGALASSNLDEVLAKKPAVAIIVAVPSERAALCERAVAAGVPVLVDKPLVLSHAGLDRLISAVEKHRRPIITYYPYRGYPEVLAAKAALDAGRIGRLVRVMSCGPHKLNPPIRPAWHWSGPDNGGALIDIGSHHMDVCCWLAGGAPTWINAMHANFDQPAHAGFQDFAQAQMRFGSGALGHVEVDWLNPMSMKNFGDTRTWILGTNGKIEIRLGDTISAEIWTHQAPVQPLDASTFVDCDTWTTRLIDDLAQGRTSSIPQADIWRASRATLYAFESAKAGGKPMESPKF